MISDSDVASRPHSRLPRGQTGSARIAEAREEVAAAWDAWRRSAGGDILQASDRLNRAMRALREAEARERA